MKNYILLICFMMTAGMVSAQALKVAQSGNVGIAEADPEFPLHVTVSDNTNGIILGNQDGAKFFQKIANNGHGQLFVRNGGNQDRLFLNAGGFSFMKGVVAINTDVFPSGNNFHVEGNSSKSAGGNVWSVPSDKRLKSNINKFDAGLNEVLQINPVSFEYNGLAGTIKGERAVGIIAQEIQKIAPYMIKEFTTTKYESDGRINGTDGALKSGSDEYLSYNGNALQYMLVNSIKEQQNIILDLQSQIEQLQDSFDELKDERVKLTVEENEIIESSLISQNEPNPFGLATNIKYRISKNTNNAEIHFFDMNGRLIKKIEIFGEGNLNIDSSDLTNGIYTYSLIEDGRIVETKKMVISK